MHGTNMTIGADTALHRITQAIDDIASTAASHQRTFVVKVMGRNCGYLALMAALATGAEWVLIPENPPQMDNWEEKMIADLRRGRAAGRRDSIVVMAEGARDKNGKPIGSTYVQKFLEDELHEEVRVTVLGHVQRGGSPSAFDRNLGTMMGYQAVDTVLAAQPEDEPQMIVIRGNRITHRAVDAMRGADARRGARRSTITIMSAPWNCAAAVSRKPIARCARCCVRCRTRPRPAKNACAWQ